MSEGRVRSRARDAVVRIFIPASIALAGLAVIASGLTVLVGVGIVVFVLSAIIRLAVRSQDDREREDAARRRFTRTGSRPAR